MSIAQDKCKDKKSIQRQINLYTPVAILNNFLESPELDRAAAMRLDHLRWSH